MEIQVVLLKKDSVIQVGDKWLFVNKDTRDAIVAANAFLSELLDKVDHPGHSENIYSIILHLSNMLYGFDEEN